MARSSSQDLERSDQRQAWRYMRVQMRRMESAAGREAGFNIKRVVPPPIMNHATSFVLNYVQFLDLAGCVCVMETIEDE